MAIPRRAVVRQDEGESIEIHVDELPDFVMDRLCSTLIESMERFFKRPGVEEEYQTWLEERKRRTPAGA